MLEAAIGALGVIADPYRLSIIALAVVIGLGIGVVPGLGGVVGLAILIPFTYSMDPLAAFAFLVGMGAVTTTSDTIPAVLFGVPGTSGSAATVVDGYPMARNGESGRAFGAAYSASLIGGVFGALLLGLSIPLLRPIMLYMGSPELLMLTVLGLSMVAVLSGKAPLRGLAAGVIGLVLAMVGLGSQGGSIRWTFEQIYLWDGLPLVPITLGLFAIPELVDMAITRSRIDQGGDRARGDLSKGQWQGVKDTFQYWKLTLRTGALGAGLGAIPGLGSAVVDWLAYGHTVRTEKKNPRFGEGDVRGVIGPEAANNAKTGGALVPTIAFGVPGSAAMALLLGAFLMHGLIPGPSMLTKNLDITYGIIWSLAIANILGAGLCLLFANQFAKVALIRFGILVPVITVVVFLGAFQSSKSWGDLAVLLLFGALGWIMKRLNWPRPPLLLGFVLGGIFERYLWLSINTSISTSETGSAVDWLGRPLVLLIMAITLWGIFSGIWPWLRRRRRGERTATISLVKPRWSIDASFSLFVMLALGYLFWLSFAFSVNDRVVPQIAVVTALVITLMILLVSVFVSRQPISSAEGETLPQARASEADTVGIATELGDHWRRRLLGTSAWIAALTVGIYVIGFLPSVAIFVLAYATIEGKERLSTSLAIAGGITVFAWILFDWAIKVKWPYSLLGEWVPALRSLTGFL